MAAGLYSVLSSFRADLQVINLIINVTKATHWGWRLSLGFAFVPSFFLFLGGVFLPDSPNSLLERGYPEQVWSCFNSLKVLRFFKVVRRHVVQIIVASPLGLGQWDLAVRSG